MRKLAIATTVALAAAAYATPASAETFNSTGWTLLGEKSIDGRVDHDTIQVGRREGTFTSVTLVATEGTFGLDGMTINFGNGERFAPEVKYEFREGQRSRQIDLPGKQRGIDTIDLDYRNLARGRLAKVQVWGREGNSGVVPNDPPADAWTETGWTVLGKARASGRRGTVTIRLKGKVRDYSELTFAVNDGDLQITNVDAVFAKGPRSRNKWGYEFRDGARRTQFLIGGDRRPIKSLRITYVNRTPARRATIQVWGKDIEMGGNAAAVGDFDERGWTMVGEHTVEGKRDHDSIPVGRNDGAFSRIAIVVRDSDLVLDDFTVTFGNRETWSPRIRAVFEQNSRSRIMDFPANRRVIDRIDVRYSNLPGGGKARIQVWAK
jgi:hypothetical protein